VTALPSAPPAWITAVVKEQQLNFTLFAGRRQLSPAEYRRRALAQLRALCLRSAVCLRIRPEHLSAVLGDGRVRNQFETGHSAGYFDPAARADLELKVLGVPLDAKAGERPIYGYLGGSDEDHALPSYGTVVLTLSEEVRPRTTFTLGDSLDQTSHARIPAFAPTPLESPELLSVDSRIDILGASVLADATAPTHRYAETQIFGGVGLTDIAEIRFTAGSRPSTELERELQNLGLPWSVSP
jgi:Protein of unknown function (DUF3626)